jgi:hypothetical protein
MLHIKRFLVLFTLIIVGGLIYYFSSSSEKIDYNTQVKPIFNKKCIACHGGVKAKSNFSLLFRGRCIEGQLSLVSILLYPVIPEKVK